LDRQLYNQFICFCTAAQRGAGRPATAHPWNPAADFESGGNAYPVDKQLVIASQDRLNHNGAFHK
jgi:hypothetical protein